MKIKKLMLLILCMSLMLSSFFSCSSKEPEELEPLSDELKEEIIATAKEKWEDDLGIVWGHFGVYNQDMVAIMCTQKISTYPASHHVTVASKEFVFPDSTEDIYIYCNSELVELSEAYEKRLVSKSDVNNIYYYYQEFTDIREEYYKGNDDSLLEYVIFDEFYGLVKK